MKILLLSLVVMMGFVYLVSGDARICHSCNGMLCTGHEECKEGQELCFKKTYKGDITGRKTVRGCADTCVDPGENENIMHCKYDKCNC